jgi:osmotically-inducible protein OsmY
LTGDILPAGLFLFLCCLKSSNPYTIKKSKKMKMKTMKTDSQIKNDVQNELKFEPILTGCEIGVSVTNEFVTLSGTVDTYAKKKSIEGAAKRVAGVKGVTMHINVTPTSAGRRNDSEITSMVMNALRSHCELPTDKISVKVEDGFVTLTGEVAWAFQKSGVYAAIQNLFGIKGIVNRLVVNPTLSSTFKTMTSSEIKQQINSAFHRSATLSPGKINIETVGGMVILTGTVGSWAELREAEYLACSAPGVYGLENKLTISPSGFGVTVPGGFEFASSEITA